MMRAFVFILYFFLALPWGFAQEVDTVKTKDVIIKPISEERTAKNKTLYQRLRNYLRSHKLTKNLDDLILIEDNSSPLLELPLLPPPLLPLKRLRFRGKLSVILLSLP